MEKKNKAKILICFLAVVLVALIAVFALLGNKNKAGTGGTDSSTLSGETLSEAEKKITVDIVSTDGTVKTVELSTKAQTLRAALEEKELIAGDESAAGLFVKTVDGVTADDSKQQWWCFTKGGEMLAEGIDKIETADGDKYEITLRTGYDM